MTPEARQYYAWVGAALKAARLSAGLTQTDVSRWLDVAPGRVSAIESGKTRAAADTIVRYAHVLRPRVRPRIYRDLTTEIMSFCAPEGA